MELKTYKKILKPQECTLIKIKYVFRKKIKSILQICFYIGRYGQNKKIPNVNNIFNVADDGNTPHLLRSTYSLLYQLFII